MVSWEGVESEIGDLVASLAVAKVKVRSGPICPSVPVLKSGVASLASSSLGADKVWSPRREVSDAQPRCGGLSDLAPPPAAAIGGFRNPNPQSSSIAAGPGRHRGDYNFARTMQGREMVSKDSRHYNGWDSTRNIAPIGVGVIFWEDFPN